MNIINTEDNEMRLVCDICGKPILGFSDGMAMLQRKESWDDVIGTRYTHYQCGAELMASDRASDGGPKYECIGLDAFWVWLGRQNSILLDSSLEIAPDISIPINRPESSESTSHELFPLDEEVDEIPY